MGKIKVAIHQPEHFPYIGFIQKMQYADIFVILDDVQYSKGNWQNRNRFLNKNKIEDFFTVQVEKNAYKKLINEVKVVPGKWRRKILIKLQQNFNVDLTDVYTYEKLFDINMNSIHWVRDKLNIQTPMFISSELNIDTTRTQRIVDIVRHFGTE